MYVIILALMVPAASGLVDCRAACHSCRENKEVPAMVEVYCSMCEECKERRRDKFAASSTTTHHDETVNFLPARVRYEEYPPPTTEPFIFGPTNDNIIEKIRNEFATADGYPFGHFSNSRHEERHRRRPAARGGHRKEESSSEEYHHLRPKDIPEGCPTPPVCSDDEEPVITVPTTTTRIATTTTTRRPCPKIRQCRKKKKPTTQRPCYMPYMPCMPMCPCPMTCPGQQCGAPTTTTATINVISLPLTTTTILNTPDTHPTLSNDYIYMFVGVPKNIIKY